MDAITEHNNQLVLKAKDTFTGLGLLSKTVVLRKSHSTIFNITGDEKMFNTLLQKNVLCAQRGNGIRLGFHFYNTENEIDAVVKILKTTL